MVPGEFDIAAPLPWGRASVRASAGTGKTWTLAALATRFVVEADVPMKGLLVVTFTRAAAAELRTRIRDRFVEVAQFIEGGASLSDAKDDPLLILLAGRVAAWEGADPSPYAGRLRAALSDFDAATIGTIHGFAQQVLGSLGSASHGGSGKELAENTIALIEEVAADVLVNAAARPEFGAGSTVALPKLRDLRSATLMILNNPGIHVIPPIDDEAQDPATHGAQIQVRLINEVVGEVQRRQLMTNTTGYTGLLTDVRDAFSAPGSTALIAELQSHYRVGLVDEFQDTDPVQWEIFSTLFPVEDATDRALITVGDPKQAIYSFRGANVHTYVDATAGASVSNLAKNYRSDGRLITALDAFFSGAEFGSDAITFDTVEAAVDPSRLRIDKAVPPALVISTLCIDNPDVAVTSKKACSVPAALEFVAADLADRVVTLLEGGEISVSSAEDLTEPASRGVRAQDIAVLVTAYSQVPAIRAALQRRGVPVVVARTGNVFESEAAEHWKWLLHGLARPADPQRARMVALSWFMRFSAEEVGAFDTIELSELQSTMASWAETLETSGVVAFRHRVWHDGDLLARVLGFSDGERIVTDLEHIAEVLAAEAGDEPVSALGLVALFNDLVLEDPDQVSLGDSVARRLESDDNAVQIMTVHVSKGLEFPIVMCPSLWSNPNHERIATNYQDEDSRVYDAANAHYWPDKKTADKRKLRAADESKAERLRLAYVALTRAQHQVVIWWVRTMSRSDPLSRLLFTRSGASLDGASLTSGKPPTVPSSRPAVHDALAPLQEQSAGTIRIEEVDGRVLTAVTPVRLDAVLVPPLAVAPFNRSFDAARRRWSFTAITAGLYEQHQRSGAAHDLDDVGADDEPMEGAEEMVPGETAGAAVASPQGEASAHVPLALVGAGAAFGTLVHEVLERVDFAQIDLNAALSATIDERQAVAAEAVDTSALAVGLEAALDTPCGPLFDDRPLRSFTRMDRLDEMSFDMPLGAGGTAATVADLGALLLATASLPPSLADWAARLAAGEIRAELGGFLTGSIDGVFRLRGDGTGIGVGGADRFIVVDYKTNLLGHEHRPLTVEDYHPDLVAEAMVHHHYPLQALLYSVALHRYLRSRLADYDPKRNLGGMAYLFVRGMIGADTPTVDGNPHGVFSWRPDAALIEDMSDLLHRGPVRTSVGAAT